MINKFDNVLTDTRVQSVYNYNEYTLEELLCKFYGKIEEIVDLVNLNEKEIETFKQLIISQITAQDTKINEFLEYMRTEGIPTEVLTVVTEMYNDGRLTEVINKLSGDVIKQISDFKLETNQTITEFKTVTNQSITEFKNHVSDFTIFPQGSKPNKNHTLNNSFKIAHKINDNTIIVIQETNKGYVKYTLTRNEGASQEDRDYGVNHELLRVIKVEHLPNVYVYTDISTPIEGTFDGTPLYEPTYKNTLESIAFSIPSNYSQEKTFSSKESGQGMGSYKLKYGTSVSYNLPVTMNNKCNLMFLGTTTSSTNIKIKVNDIEVKQFNPKSYVIETSNGVGLVEFNVPTKSTTNSNIKITISNEDSTGYVYLCGINVKTLKDFNGEHITDYKCFGSTSNGWISSNGASDYALFDEDTQKWFGSYHGGELLEFEQITWGTQKVQENEYYVTTKTLATIPLNEWVILKDFKIYQVTNLASGKATMISNFSFNTIGSIDMNFSYTNGTVNLSNFYTALTCTDVGFRYIYSPIFKNLNEPNGTYEEIPLSEGYVSQVNPTDSLQLDIRFTKFNEEFMTRKPVIANNLAYRKFYYGCVYGKSKIVNNVNFSKSLDFIVR